MRILASKRVVAFIVGIILDNICCFVLNSTFNSQTLDVLVLCVVRTLCVPVLVYCAAKYGMADFHVKESIGKDLKLVSVQNDKDTSEAELQADKIATLYYRVSFTVIYGLLGFSLLLTGAKCVILSFENDYTLVYQQASMIGLVFVLNFELYMCGAVVADYHLGNPYRFPKLHSHPLYRVKEVGGFSRCGACDSDMFGHSYACLPCQFNLCESCSKKDLVGMDGLMRNDKGIVDCGEFNYKDYLILCYGFLKRHVAVLSISFICLIISAVVNTLVPNLQGDIIDSITKLDTQGFRTVIVRYAVIHITLVLASSAEWYCLTLVGRKMYTDVQVTLFQNILKQDIAFFDGVSAGLLSSRLTFDTDNMFAPVNHVLSSFISHLVLLISGVSMCTYISWKLTILAFSILGPITILHKEYSTFANKVNAHVWHVIAKGYKVLDESLSNIKVVRSFTQEHIQEIKYVKERNEILKGQIKLLHYDLVTSVANKYIEQVIVVLILWYGGILVMEPSTLSIGSLIKFQLYWAMCKTNYDGFMGTFRGFTKAEGSARHVMQLLACKPAIEPHTGDTCTSVGDIEIKDLTYYFQMNPSKIVLQSLNLQIKKGHVVALVGKSGSGKTTIVNLLQRFYDPKEGTIFLNGADLRSFNPSSYRSHIGVVAQDTQLLNESFYNNITLFNEYTMEQVIDAAKKANAHSFIMENPLGYETKVGEKGSRLSGGQRQRIALARAFLRQPALLLLDEATSALDADSESLVQEAIDNLIATRMCTVVLVAHRLSTVAGADLIAVVEGGTIVESGNHSQLMAKGGFYASMVEKQTRKLRNLIEEDD